MRGWHCDPWDLREAAGRGPGDGRVSTFQQELSVVDDSGASGRGGEERAPGSLAVAVGQLGPVLEGEHACRDGDALHLVCGCGHGCGRCGEDRGSVEARKEGSLSGSLLLLFQIWVVVRFVWVAKGLRTETNGFMATAKCFL